MSNLYYYLIDPFTQTVRKLGKNVQLPAEMKRNILEVDTIFYVAVNRNKCGFFIDDEAQIREINPEKPMRFFYMPTLYPTPIGNKAILLIDEELENCFKTSSRLFWTDTVVKPVGKEDGEEKYRGEIVFAPGNVWNGEFATCN